jgi:hypothetical protein
MSYIVKRQQVNMKFKILILKIEFKILEMIIVRSIVQKNINHKLVTAVIKKTILKII